MHDYIAIGCVPSDEECLPVRHPGALEECCRFRDLIEEVYPPVFAGYLKVVPNSHDFGTYYEVHAFYNTDIPESEQWALMVEWDKEGLLRNWKVNA